MHAGRGRGARGYGGTHRPRTAADAPFVSNVSGALRRVPLFREALQPKTVVAGGDGGPDSRRVATCDAVDCNEQPRKESFVCMDHERVRVRTHSVMLAKQVLC